MGLTIHYRFDAGNTSKENIEALIYNLYSKCQDLPFTNLGKVVRLEAEECLYINVDDPLYVLKFRATKCELDNFLNWRRIIPSTILGFSSLPREGCEEFDTFLCQYGEGQWTSKTFCKTQRAVDFGVENFVIAHCTIVKFLDYAQALGILSYVSDEADYWSERNLKKLIYTVEQSKISIAAIKTALSQYNSRFIDKLISNL